MPDQKGSALPLIILSVVVVILIGVVFYFMGVFKSTQIASETPVVTPPLSTPITEVAPTGDLVPPATPAPSAYANPFTEDDSYENPFNNL